MPQVDIKAKFVVAAGEILDEGVARHRSLAPERSRFNPRMGRSRDFRRPWSASIRLFAYCSVT
jgi:hypothetical protein